MIGVISWIIAAFSGYGAISGYNILGQETNSASVIVLAIVSFVFFFIGVISFSKGSSGSGYGSSSSSDDGGFFSFMSFDGGSDSGGCDSGGDSGSCGGD